MSTITTTSAPTAMNTSTVFVLECSNFENDGQTAIFVFSSEEKALAKAHELFDFAVNYFHLDDANFEEDFGFAWWKRQAQKNQTMLSIYQKRIE